MFGIYFLGRFWKQKDQLEVQVEVMLISVITGELEGKRHVCGASEFTKFFSHQVLQLIRQLWEVSLSMIDTMQGNQFASINVN